MKKLLWTLLVLCGTQSALAYHTGEVVLYPAIAHGGMAGVPYQTLRVGLVHSSNGEYTTVQEINHPSRYGLSVYAQDENGNLVLSEGKVRIQTTELISRALNITAKGVILQSLSHYKCRLNRSTQDALVLYVFKNGQIAVTPADSQGAVDFTNYGADAFLRGPVSIHVVTPSTSQ